jgi:hypothetical protein
VPDPTMSNEPREGLPPCVSAVVFESRAAFLWDGNCECAGSFSAPLRFCAAAGYVSGKREAPGHAGTMMPIIPEGDWPWHRAHLDTDDPDEAQAAFERGAEWVRTGEME